MEGCYSIADHKIRVAGGALRRLLLGFEFVEANEQGDSTPPVCSVHHAESYCQHGVESFTAPHPVSHVMGLSRWPAAVLQADAAFENLTVRADNDDGLSELMLTGIYSRLISYKTVLVHAALVEVPEVGGILFIGRSGVGKTTQARLWSLYGNATIINGDKVFLGTRSDFPGQIMAYGSPWKGNSPYRVNRRVPLAAVVSLVRLNETFVRRLSPVESLAAWMPAVFMPGWDLRLTETVMETLDGMIPAVPVFEMSCHPDATAVDMLSRALAEL